ncbi:MAG TPA: type II secretion system F family protein [Planctomycetota bacterium]|jgi:type IV pilus assembly protein PilC|nr:type II secretion system F family protein [Planctomycetota bacterium]
MAKRIQRTAPRPAGAAVAVAQAPAGAQAAPAAPGKRRGGRVSRGVVTDFTIQLATLTEAGIPVVKALAILEGQTRPGPFKHVLQELAEDVAAGTPLSESMSKHEKCFDRFYWNMVRAGEAGGVLDRVLYRLAQFLERAAMIQARIKSATIYPAVVATVAVAVVSAVIIWVIPKFREIFTSFNIELPGMTQFLLDTSGLVVRFWYVFFGLPVIAFIVHRVLMKRSQPYRYRIHKLQLTMPLLGPLVRKALIATFARTFGTLIQAGVPHLDALGIVRDATSNEVLLEGVESIRKTVREGEGISRPMGETGLFDDLVTNMVDVGEATGELDKMLIKVADSYEVALERRIDGLFKLLEPAMLILVAGFVGFIVISLFLPLMTIMSQVGNI